MKRHSRIRKIVFWSAAAATVAAGIYVVVVPVKAALSIGDAAGTQLATAVQPKDLFVFTKE